MKTNKINKHKSLSRSVPSIASASPPIVFPRCKIITQKDKHKYNSKLPPIWSIWAKKNEKRKEWNLERKEKHSKEKYRFRTYLGQQIEWYWILYFTFLLFHWKSGWWSARQHITFSTDLWRESESERKHTHTLENSKIKDIYIFHFRLCGQTGLNPTHSHTHAKKHTPFTYLLARNKLCSACMCCVM